jgi:hypothetical protein
MLGPSPSLGQTGPQAGSGRPSEPDTGADVTCAGAAVYWAGSGPEVHVTRRGTIGQSSPLAPQSGAEDATVLEVRIRGKPAAAYGPSFAEMRRAGPPHELEQQFGAAIQWDASLSLPRQFLVVDDDASAVVARLRFVKCLPPPKARPARQQPARPRPAEPPPAPAELPPGISLPEGAIR